MGILRALVIRFFDATQNVLFNKPTVTYFLTKEILEFI